MESSVIIFTVINLLIGAVLLFFGLKFMKFTVGLIGFLIGFTVANSLLTNVAWDSFIVLLISIAIGILVAAIAFGFYKFVVTLSIALFFGNLVYAIAFAAGTGVIGALIAAAIVGVLVFVLVHFLKIVDTLFAISTALQGSALILTAVYVFMNPELYAAANETQSVNLMLTLAGWWFVAWIGLAAVGAFFQLAGHHSKRAETVEE